MEKELSDAEIKANQEHFWDNYKRSHGIDQMSEIDEANYWYEAALLREECIKSSSPDTAIKYALPFDRQLMLEKWWNKLDTERKEYYLYYVWMTKGPSLILGYDWWIPYFKEVGVISNFEIQIPDSILLYRGALPNLKCGMSWADDINFAERFASQYPNQKIYTIVAKKADVLGVFKGEVVVFEEYGKNETVTEGIEYVLNHKKIASRIKELETDSL